ncbi:MAG: DUF4345 domain-containing protein [Rhodobiaceae bacterium]|nr:DUF4345 domain-containing protein [Rhodobiaceae bacterium]
MHEASQIIFRAILFLAGGFVVLLGLDIGLGGITTRGWLGSSDFLAVTDTHAYAVQDNHVKFLGGVWLGVGLALCAGAWNPTRFAQTLRLVFALIFFGGVMRLLSDNPEIAFAPDIMGSLVAELVGMPILYLWHRQVLRSGAAAAT